MIHNCALKITVFISCNYIYYIYAHNLELNSYYISYYQNKFVYHLVNIHKLNEDKNNKPCFLRTTNIQWELRGTASFELKCLSLCCESKIFIEFLNWILSTAHIRCKEIHMNLELLGNEGWKTARAPGTFCLQLPGVKDSCS